MSHLLEIKNLRTHFPTRAGLVRAVDDVSFYLDRGELLVDDKDLLKLSDAEMRGIRGDDIAMMFQDPMTSLNPVFTVGEQIAEALRLHRKMSHKDARAATIEVMREVAIPDPARRLDD